MVSLPAPPLTTSESMPASTPLTVTCAASPLTTTDEPLLATLMWSSPAVPLTFTVSASPSPWPLPGVADRSIATCLTSVPVRSLTVTLSAPPKRRELDVLDAVEVHGDVADVAEQPHPRPLAEMSMFSLTLAPLNTSVSVPA